MSRYLIDANLPKKVSLWQTGECSFVSEIDENWTDTQIWEFAKLHGLTIVTKDADFSHRIMMQSPPPRVIHLKVGNLRLQEFAAFVDLIWDSTCTLSQKHRLVNVFRDRIEAVE